MKNKFILKLFIFMVFTVSLYSCIHDDVSSASDPSSKEYTNKTLWKQDEKYIKNVMQVYQENEDKIKKAGGTPYWDYASTLESFDESFLMVPIVEAGRVVSIMQVPRHGSRIHFYYTNFQSQIEFFQALVFAKYKKASDASETDKTIVCKTVTVSVWLPDNESNPEPESGAGHWGVHSVVKCRQMLDNCSGVVGPNGECITGGGAGDPGDFPYPGGGGNPETPVEDPCQKTKSDLNKPNVKQGINIIKAQALKTLSNVNAGEIGFKEKKDGTIVPADVNSAHQVVFNDVTDGYGAYHNHTATGTHMFSPPDIIDTLLGFASAQSIDDGAGNAYLGMIAGEWCNTCPNNVQYIHYVIQYIGTGTELGGLVYTPAQMNQFLIDYRKKVNRLLKNPLNSNNNGTTLNNVGLEKLFFDTLKNIGINGKINLQRVESNGVVNNITENSNGTINVNPCP
ncbi:hypothetical protein M2347_003334 [Chryseobacterium sp. H1D6B]|uniref:hypothetical protein n=1 Tax=Chryseobacterium sp. H1D6B TaxID=2940588 RepID=UPI0015CAAA19|nr:hypothetical protein [Chryseobacterium sp. H1D6B]MDH6253607.1 hypothetical protein [Chryseobacterium sp. H1D6B]